LQHSQLLFGHNHQAAIAMTQHLPLLLHSQQNHLQSQLSLKNQPQRLL
jgi:hypothetical protein